jgi:hypothetical protein
MFIFMVLSWAIAEIGQAAANGDPAVTTVITAWRIIALLIEADIGRPDPYTL